MPDPTIDFEQIHAQFRPRVLRYLARLVGDGEAEDLAQAVFLKVSQGIEGFRGEASLSTWIYRIATNVALDRLRTPSVKREIPSALEAEGEPGFEELAGCSGETSSLPDRQLIRKEMNSCIRGVVETIPGHYRTVLALAELEELKDREIADILQVSLGTVKIRLHRARTRLRKELECRCSFYRDERGELACDRKQGADETAP